MVQTFRARCAKDGGLISRTRTDFEHSMIGRDLSQLGHQGHDERLRYGLAETDRNRPVRVCNGARSLRDEQMAFRLPHGLKDPVRQALLSQNTGVGTGVGPDGFDHGGAFADALCVLSGRFPRDCNHGKHGQQQGLHDRALRQIRNVPTPVLAAVLPVLRKTQQAKPAENLLPRTRFIAARSAGYALTLAVSSGNLQCPSVRTIRDRPCAMKHLASSSCLSQATARKGAAAPVPCR
jgi:hypothetical protein